MSLASSIVALAAVPTAECFVGGRRVTPLSAVAELGFDIVSSTGTIVLASRPAWLSFRDDLEIRLGWDGQTVTVFKGEVESIDERYDAGGYTVTVTGAGSLKNAQRAYWDAITYAGDTDEEIVADLLDKVGVDGLSIEGASEVFGVLADVVHEAGAEPWDLINRLDEVTGYRTWNAPDGGVRRRRVSGIPSAGSARTFTEGEDFFSVGRPRTIRNVHNHVIVTGRAGEVITPVSERFAPSPYVPTPPGYISYDFQSDLIEDGTLSDAVAERLMGEVNRVTEEVPLSCKGDPRRQPGETVAVVSASVGFSSGENMWVRHVTHRYDAGGYTTDLTLEGGRGQEGYSLDVNPIAAFTYRLTRETFDESGTPATYYTVTADGSASSDPDGLIAAYAWENSENADVATIVTYATKFTAAEVAAGATITLTVTDNDANIDALTLPVTAAAKDVLVRDLYIAAGALAEATQDGGTTWNDWAPASAAVSTPPIAGEDHSYFGLADGKLYRTDDYLATTPTLVHDFGSQVNAIWIHEANADRVTVGLANGKVFNTVNASALGSSAWNELADYGDAVLDIVESGFQAGQYRVTTGDSLRITYSEFAADEALITWSGGMARAIVPTIVGLPGVGTASATDPVQSEDGTVYTYDGTPPTDVRAGTHHIRQAVVLVADRAGKVWRTAEGGTEFAHVGTLGAGDPANSAIRDGDNAEVFYVAADDAAWKSFDGGATWGVLRAYTGGGQVAHRMGYGGLRALNIAPVTVLSEAGQGLTLSLWNGTSNDAPPAGWTEVAYDDSGWAAPVEATDTYPPDGDPTNHPAIAGTEKVWPTALPAAVGEPAPGESAIFRHSFTLGAGVVTAATLTFRADEIQRGAWINNVFVGADLSPAGEFTPPAGDPADLGPDLVIEIDPAIVIPDAENVLALWVESNRGVAGFGAAWASYKLEVT